MANEKQQPLVPGEIVKDAIVDLAVLKEKVDTIQANLKEHERTNLSDFREVHARLSKLRDEIGEDLEEGRQEVQRLDRWKWMMTGFLLTMTFIMTALQTYSAFFGAVR